MNKIAILGAGASGFFAAFEVKKLLPRSTVILIEKSKEVLTKVRLSGGKRCNITHACFDPRTLSSYYPRGEKFLLPLFTQFQPKDMIAWLENRLVFVTTEADGRIFPSTNSSETIISCFLEEKKKLGILLEKEKKIEKLYPKDKGIALVEEGRTERVFDAVLLTTGSAKEPLEWIRSLDIEIVPQVPSLFSFLCPRSPLLSLPGTAVQHATIDLLGSKISGSLLLTHTGFSGPIILKASSLFARKLADLSYKASFFIDWLPEHSFAKLHTQLHSIHFNKSPFPELSQKLWKALLIASHLERNTVLSSQKRETLLHILKKMPFQMEGKHQYTEFVTAGGVALEEVHPKRLESKKISGLFFAGEILDIDGLTGGFNLQAAWTTAYHAAHGIASRFQQ